MKPIPGQLTIRQIKIYYKQYLGTCLPSGQALVPEYLPAVRPGLSALVPRYFKSIVARKRLLQPLCLCASVPLYLFIFNLLSLIFFLSSCDAPRQNPLDPENPNNHYHSLRGSIQTLSIPHHPVDRVAVVWPDQSLWTQSTEQGNFVLEMISPRDGWVYFRHEDYFEDSLFIPWQNQTTVTILNYLNALPKLDSLQIYSVILNRYPTLQTEQVVIRVKLTDHDNDTDSVLAVNRFVNSRHTLAYNVNDKWYQKTLSLYDLQVIKSEELVGHPFEIIVKDFFGRSYPAGAADIQRVLREEIVFISPSGNEVTSPQPVLTWQKYSTNFSFTLWLQVFTAEITPQLVWGKDQLESITISCTVDQPLPAGEYFWVVWASDEFGNRTRSKPASFKVE